MSAASNTLAQGFKAYEEGWSAVDPVAFVHFIILAIITTPPNYKWQSWLEKTFPTNKRVGPASAAKKDDNKPAEEEKTTLSVTNTIAKFLLDQTVGATLNTVWFIFMINLLRGQSISHIIATVQNVSLQSTPSLSSLADSFLPPGFLLHDHSRLQVLALNFSSEPRRCPIRSKNACGRAGWAGMGHVYQFDADVISA